MTANHGIPQEALDSHVGILGITGSGKSNLAKTVVEDLDSRNKRVCVIDPTGTWYGLRLHADGKTPSGHQFVIFGGQHGDLPLEAEHGEAIARAVGTTSTPVILDTRQMKVAGRTNFFTDFAETLIRTNRGELNLVIDEAHLFMPQGGASVGGSAPAMLHAGNNLVSLGRGVGLRIILISQRPAKLHKDSLTQVNTLVAMKLTAPQDRKAIDAWIGEWVSDDEGTNLQKDLPYLKTGDAWIWAPGIPHLKKTRTGLTKTFDTGSVRVNQNLNLPKIDVDEIAAILKQDGTDIRENDPKVLHKRIAKLERDLRKQAKETPKAIVDETAVAKQVKQIVRKDRREQASRINKVIETYQSESREIRNTFLKEHDQAQKRFIDALQESQPEPDIQPVEASTPKRTPVERPIRQPRAKVNGKVADEILNEDLTNPEIRVLKAMRWIEESGLNPKPTRVQIAFFAGYKPTSGGFNNIMGTLRTKGMINFPEPKRACLTAEGLDEAPESDTELDAVELHTAVMAKLSTPEQRVLRPLIDSYPDAISVNELAEEAGYQPKSGGFNNLRGKLRSLGLVDYPQPGMVAALPVLFFDE